MKKLTIFLLLFTMLSGCSAVPNLFSAGSALVTGVIMWKNNEAHKYYHSNSTAIYQATKRACNSLDYEVIKERNPKPGSFEIIAGKSDRFNIKIRPAEKNITELVVRVNFLGDKPYAELLYKEVDDQLGIIEFDQK